MFEAALIAIYSLTVLLGLWVCFTKPQWFPVLLVLCLPTGNFIFDLGVTWTPWKVLLLLYWISLPAQYAMHADIKKYFTLPVGISLYLVAVVISTLVIYGFGQSYELGNFVGFRDPVTRPLVQLLSLLLRVSLIVAILAFVRSKDAVYRLWNGIIAASTLVSLYGLYQMMGYYLGWPIMGINRAEQNLSGGYGLFNVHGIEFFRLGSYVGEPKEAAKFLLLSTILLVGIRLLGVKQCSKWLTNYGILTLHVVALTLTFATSAFFAFAISAPLLAALWLILVKRVRVRSFVACAIGVTFALALLVNVVGEGLSKEVYEARVNARVGSIDSPEGAALQFLSDHPEYLATGVGLGNSSFYLRPYFNPNYSHMLTVSLNSYYLELLVEGGFLGLAMLLLFLATWIVKSIQLIMRLRVGETKSLLAIALGSALTVAVAAAFSSTEGTGQLWVFFGLLISACRIAERETVALSFSLSSQRQLSILHNAHSH